MKWWTMMHGTLSELQLAAATAADVWKECLAHWLQILVVLASLGVLGCSALLLYRKMKQRFVYAHVPTSDSGSADASSAETHRQHEEMFDMKKDLLVEMFSQTLDIATDLRWALKQWMASHRAFASLSIGFGIASSLLGFMAERFSWKQVESNPSEPGDSSTNRLFFEKKDRHGNHKPAGSRFLAHVFQVVPIIDGIRSYREGAVMPTLRLRLIFEGIVEGMPSFILQTYAALLYSQWRNASAFELLIVVLTIGSSLKSAATAVSRLAASSAVEPEAAASEQQKLGGALSLLWHCFDVAARLFTFSLLSIALRPPSADEDDVHQELFAPIMMLDVAMHIVIFIGIVGRSLWRKSAVVDRLKRLLLCFVAAPPVVLPLEGANLMQGLRLRRAMLAWHACPLILVTLLADRNWHRGQVDGADFAIIHILAVSTFLVSAACVVADEASLALRGIPLLPTEDQALHAWMPWMWLSAQGRIHTLQRLYAKEVSSADSHPTPAAVQGMEVACRHGQVDSVRFLHSRGFPMVLPDGITLVNERGVHFSSCSQMASYYGHLAIVEFEVDQIGGEKALEVPNSVDGFTCAQLASENGHLEVLRYVVQEIGREKALEAQNSVDGGTCAQLASQYGHLEVLHYIVQEIGREKALEAPNSVDGSTCAILASQYGHLEVLSYVVQEIGREKALEVPNRVDGSTCAQLASQNGHLEVLSYIEEQIGSNRLRSR